MEKEGKNKKQLLEEIEELRIRLEEAEETLLTIRSGGVDALIVSGTQGDQLFTLTGAERVYRVLIETMNEGAVSLNQEGIIIYCNQRFSEMIKTPLEKVIGTPMRQFIRASDLPVFDSLIEKGSQENGKGEVAFINNDGTMLPVLLSISALQGGNANISNIVVTDLTAQKHIEEELRRHRDNLEQLVKDRTNELETSNQRLQEEITERKQAESELKLNESRLEALLELNQMTNPSLQELTNFALEEAIRLTRSTIGYFAFMNEEETVLTMHAWSKAAMEECSISDKPIIYPVATTGLWGEAVRQRRPVITNDYGAQNPLKKGYPDGHVKLTRHMNVPIFDGNQIVIVAGVGNKPSDYDESDVRQLTLLMQGMWRIIQRKRAEEALRGEKNFIEDALNSLSDVFFVFDLNGKFMRWNKTMNAVSGYSDAEISLMKPTDFFFEEDRQRVVEAIQIAAREGYATVEARVVTKNGRNIPFEFTGSLLIDYKKNPFGVCGVGRDITERKQAEEAIERLRRQHELILNSAGEGILGLDLQGNHTFVNPAAARMLGYEVGELLGKHSHTIWHHSRADGSTHPEEECPIYITFKSGAIHCVRDEVFWRKDGTSFPAAYTSTPIKEDDKTIGAVVAFRDITERKQVEEALRETRDYMEKLLNYANAPIVVWDPKFTITGFNHAFERLTGYKDKEVIGLKLHMLFPEANREESLKKIGPTSSSEYRESVEIPILCKDGSIRIVLWNSANIYAKDATTLIATIAQGQDITERKKAEEKIRRLNRLYSMLYEINEVIIRIRGQKELFRKACQIAVEKGLFRMTWIEHIDPDSHSLKSIVHGEYGEEYLDKIRISIKEAPEGFLPISTAIRTGKYVICNDFKDDSCIHPCRDEAIKCGYHSMAAFPLQIGTHIIGAINFYSGEPHFFDDEEISALTQLSEDISFALEHIEQQEQLQKRIEELEKFYEMGIERELRMKDLKKEMKLLKNELSNYKKDNSSERA